MSDEYFGVCDISDWENIVAVNAGHSKAIGLKRDGTVVTTQDEFEKGYDLSGWKDTKTTP